MSNDLVSRKEVIRIMDELGYVNCRDGRDFEANSRVDKCRQKVLELPPAYDADKVVDRLEEKALEHAITGQQYGEEGYDNLETQEQNKKHGIEEAIEIVKSGGIENR